MQTGYTGYVDRSEWWWTVVVSVSFVLVTFVPYIIVAVLGGGQANLQMMGALHDPIEAAAQIARMQQGADGQILLSFLYTPQAQPSVLIHPLYVLLGQLVRFSQLSAVIIFHLMRFFVSIFMYMTIYHLGAHIWVKVRARRMFFIMASAVAGLGWLVAILFGWDQSLYPLDLTLPQAFPLYASAANVHYPLAIACIALLVAVIMPALRPGEDSEPSADNSGLMVFLTSVILAFVYPVALIPLGLAYGATVAINWYIQRKITRREFYWGLWILVPALPIIIYYLLTIMSNDFVTNWLNQRWDTLPPGWMIPVSLGIPLVIALPGLIRAVRRFEPDGDRFMLIWLVAMLVSLYVMPPLNQDLLLGLLIPIGYFATRATEDFWFEYIRRIYRPRIYVVMFPLLVLSHLLWIFLPIYPIIANWNIANHSFLNREYGATLLWLDQNAGEDSLILAGPQVSLWIPAWSGLPVVYGHPDESYNAEEASANVINWYQADDASDPICTDLIDRYQVDYVLQGVLERGIGANACLENLQAVLIIDESITIYATDYSLPE
ncbi:MAG: hypothetical protein ACFE0Q_07335 [Anaerolineae bacterium]